MSFYTAVLTLLVALSSGVWAIGIDEWGVRVQPDGTTFEAYVLGDEFSVHKLTSDGYEFVYGSDGYYYYAELDARGEYQASPYKVGIDDPASNGIPQYLQRSAARIAEINAARIARGYARDPDNSVKGLAGDPTHFVCSPTNKCKAYVVLVTFADIATGYYADDDQPYGYSWDLFNQFFNGGYETGVPAYTGNIVRQAVDRPAETEMVFGSLRAYFAEVYGEDIIEFHILNRENQDGSPRWLQLPGTKYDYANQDLRSSNPASDMFWNEAEAAVRADNMNGDAGDVLENFPFDMAISSFPFKTAPASPVDTLLANKAIYVYAGLSLTNNSTLHPQVDDVTFSATDPGARMVMGERQGWDWGHNAGEPDGPPPNNADHTVDRFAGIGLHVHEWGHLFGFLHPEGTWTGTNPHPNPDQTGDFSRANILGWGVMQDGAHGPVIEGETAGRPSNYRLAYRSCPNPYNPFYRMDLGWNNRELITGSEDDKVIRPGPAYIYVVPSINGQDYLLDFRDVNDPNKNFGQYAAYNELSSSGLLIWRRRTGTDNPNPMLIPADGRSIFDARFPKGKSDPSDIMFNDLPSDPFGAAAQPHGPTTTEATSILENHSTTFTNSFRPDRANPAPNNAPITPSFLAFRNIEINGAYAEVDIRFIPLPPTNLRAVESADNAVVLSWTNPRQNGDGILGYQYRVGESNTWLPSLDAEPLTLITSGATIPGLANTDPVFQVRTVTAGSTPDNVSAASNAAVLDRAGHVEVTAEDARHTPPTVGDELKAELTDPNVSNWSVIAVNWQWQRKRPDDDDTDWTDADDIKTVHGGSNTDSYTLTDDDVGRQIRAVATHYIDPIANNRDTATSDPVKVNSRPKINTTEEAVSPSVEEDSSEAVYMYTATDPDADNTIAWSLGGTNESLFEIDTDGVLTFGAGAAPNFEELGEDHPYEVNVIASDGSLSAVLTVSVTVTNVEEDGAVFLNLNSTAPTVATNLTATLTDPDGGITAVEWQWQRGDEESDEWKDIEPLGATASAPYAVGTYRVVAADIGYQLRAKVSYQDGHGSNTDTAVSVASAAVLNRAPRIEGRRQVSYAENNKNAVGEYTASDLDGHAIQWLALADDSAFTLQGSDTDRTRSLHFKEPPDYETKKEYRVPLQVRDNVGAAARDPNAYLTTTLVVEVTVTNGDDEGIVKLPSSPPRVGRPFTAELQDPDGPITGACWMWQRAADAKGRWTDLTRCDEVRAFAGDAAAAGAYPELSSYTPTAKDVGWLLRARVRYRDGLSGTKYRRVDSAASEPVEVSGALTLAGPDNPDVVETATKVGLYKTNAAGTALKWSLSGADKGSFVLREVLREDPTVRELHFASPPNYEQPTDKDGKNTYEVTVIVGDGTRTASVEAVVHVRNEEELGIVKFLSSPPGVGRPFTAELQDPDGRITRACWTWQRAADAKGRWTDLTSCDEVWAFNGDAAATASASYTPTARDAGWLLRTSVRYRDGQSGDAYRRVVSAASEPVVSAALTLEGPDNPHVVETATKVGLYETNAAAGTALEWSLDGADKGSFVLGEGTTARALHFASPPNYEQPTDKDRKNTYEVTVIVDDGTRTASEEVLVAVKKYFFYFKSYASYYPV